MVVTKENVVTWQGDIWAGAIRTQLWLAHLAASRDRLLLTGPLGVQYELSADQVKKVEPAVGKFLWWKWRVPRAIRIVHRHSAIADKLVFQAKTTTATEMLQALKEIGYNVP